MKEKKWNFCALGMGIVIFIFKLIQMIANVLEQNVENKTTYGMLPRGMREYLEFAEKLAPLAGVIIPILIVLIIVCLLGGNKEKTFGGKWGGWAISVFCLLSADALRVLLLQIEHSILGEMYLFALISRTLCAAGFVIFILSLLNKKHEKLAVFGIGALAVSTLVRIINMFDYGYTFGEMLTGPYLFMLVAFVLLALLSTKGLPENARKPIRNATVVLLVLAGLFGIDFYSIFFIVAGVIAWLSYTYFLVPGKFKMPKTLSFFVALLYAVIALVAIPRLVNAVEMEVYFDTVYLFVAVVGLILLCIGFAVKKLRKLTLFGFGTIAISAAMELFYSIYVSTYYETVLATFIYNSETIMYLISAAAAMLAAMLLCMAIANKSDSGKSAKLRTWAIVCTVVAALLGASEIGGAYMMTGLSPMYLVFAVTTVLAALVLVPLTYTMEQGIGKFLFLTVITFGVWYLIWIYNVTKHLNTVEGLEQRKTVRELLLCMFLPLYTVYWHYKTAKLMDAYAKYEGTKLEILSLVFGLVAPIVSAVLIQEKLNGILKTA